MQVKKYKVYVTKMLPREAIDLLQKECEVEINPEDRVLTKEELLEKVKGRDGVICLLTDAIDEEPEITPELLELENVVLAPHIASASVETRTKMALMAAENLLAGLKGKAPPNLINQEVLSH